MNSVCEVAARQSRQIKRQADSIMEYRKQIREIEEAFNQWGNRIMMDAEFIQEMRNILRQDAEKPTLANTQFAEVAQGQAKESRPVQSV